MQLTIRNLFFGIVIGNENYGNPVWIFQRFSTKGSTIDSQGLSITSSSQAFLNKGGEIFNFATIVNNPAFGVQTQFAIG